mmetsp:Transcript_22195/g.63683  ORF Transcript_22195/g.63683 Transcript_22195/m.63683 type:complete len:87 (-) Transcript_22195:68-328(-)
MAYLLLVFFDLDCFVWCPILGSLSGPCSVSLLQLNCNCVIKQLQVNFSKTTGRQDLTIMHRLKKNRGISSIDIFLNSYNNTKKQYR